MGRRSNLPARSYGQDYSLMGRRHATMGDVLSSRTSYCENSAEKRSTLFAVSPFTPAFTQYAERPDQTVGALSSFLGLAATRCRPRQRPGAAPRGPHRWLPRGRWAVRQPGLRRTGVLSDLARLCSFEEMSFMSEHGRTRAGVRLL